ncbi:MAG TPA: apolipoprotein N-acyltransferase [Myxococcota bacterium]|nr:apolipoprotein N-acyltransferase [Myxococcota bacterium]
MTRRSRLALLCGYAAATFLSFPHPVGSRVLDLGLLCGWLSPGLLLLGLGGLAPRRAAVHGFLAGWLTQAAILHWIYVVSVEYGHAAPPLGVIAIFGLAAHAGAFSAAFAWLWSTLDRRALGSPLAAALLWTAIDYARGAGALGFPWAAIGYSQHANPALLALSAYTGVHGMTFAVVLGSAALAGAARAAATRRPLSKPALGWLAAGAALCALGALLRVPGDEGAARIRVAVLQGNIEQGVKWQPQWAESTLEIYEALARRAAAEGAQLIVLPETAVPGALNADPALRARLAALARETRAAYVVGSVAVEARAGEREVAFYDSAFAIEPSGEHGARYDKSQLVPFGEFVPLGRWLGRLFSAVARGMATERVTPGAGPRALSVEVPAAAQPIARVGVPICYELLFPDVTRRFAREGAELLLAITNDAWYGRTGAPYQLLAMTAVRSAESGLWTARAANTGVSAFIDARGRVLAQTRIFERDLLVADLPLRAPPRGGTFYARHGDVFAYGCGLGTALLAAASALRKRRHERA